MNITMDYSSFKVEEFCKDSDFIGWVTFPTEESEHFWNTFLATYPHKSKDIHIATEYIKTFHFQEIEPSTQDLGKLKQRIWNDIAPPAILVHWWQRPNYWAAAAVVLIVVSLGLLWFNKQPAFYETAYGEIQKIKLADGSVVTLNANSSMKVEANLANDTVREVWLDGEAYFDIAKHKGAKFIVHTPEAQVEVLGTEFNVNTRRKQTQVILHEGKVKLQSAKANTPAIVMKPGDMATVSANTKQKIQLKIVQPEQYDVWRESIVILNDKTVAQIVAILEDTYGIKIQFEDSLILNKKLTGKLSLKSDEDFVENLAIILDVEVEKTDKGYIFR